MPSRLGHGLYYKKIIALKNIFRCIKLLLWFLLHESVKASIWYVEFMTIVSLLILNNTIIFPFDAVSCLGMAGRLRKLAHTLRKGELKYFPTLASSNNYCN